VRGGRQRQQRRRSPTSELAAIWLPLALYPRSFARNVKIQRITAAERPQSHKANAVSLVAANSRRQQLSAGYTESERERQSGTWVRVEKN